MHILVCDDDAAFAAQMDEYISEWFRAREIQVQSTVCTSGEQLLATPELERYQLAFLDVDLKTTDGIALGRKLRQVAPDIVLVYISAYLEFAPQGYTVNAYRYLLKRDIAAQLPSCLEDIFSGMSDLRKTLEVHHNRTTSEIPLDQIYYLESDLRQINVYGDIPHQPICTFYGKIADLPAMLYENGFLQVGRLLRLYLQLLLAVDAAVLAVGAQLKDLVALLFNAGDAAGILAPHNVHQTLGGLGLLLADSLAVFNNGHADVRVQISQHIQVQPGGIALYLNDVLAAAGRLFAAGVLDQRHAGSAVARNAQQIHQTNGSTCLDVVDDNTVLNLVNIQHISFPPSVLWGLQAPAES